MEVTEGLITLGGVILGGILTQSSDWVKSRIDKRQKYNLALFSLLDVYHALRRFDSGRFDRVLQNVITKQFPDIANNQQEFNILRSNLLLAANDIIVEGLINVDELEKLYQSSIVSLAPIDPWMAYTLSGRVDTLKYLQQTKKFATLLSSDKELTNVDKLYLETVAKSKIVNDLLETVQEDILYISKVLGKKSYKNAQNKVATIKTDSDREVEAKVNAFVDTIKKEGLNFSLE